MFTLNCKGKLLDLSTPVVMGIINTTPDSFYSGSRHATTDAALQQAERMLAEGAAILDIGGQSTRPGSEILDADAEAKRVLPVIEAIHARFPDSILSVDTYYSTVASQAVAAGASMVNDISGGQFDKGMLPVVASLHVPFICMHLEGSPGNMHQQRIEGTILPHLLDYFTKRIIACEEAGIIDLVLDPGFGFSKTVEQNFEIVKNTDILSILQKPLLLGVSRKSTIWKTLGITADEALNGTTVLNTAGLLKGASILRVHDVKEAREAVTLTQYLK